MDSTTLLITLGLLAFMVERITNGIAVILGYWPWWRERMEVSPATGPDTQISVDRNRRVGLFVLGAMLGILGSYLVKLDILGTVPGFATVPSGGRYIITGLLIASGADPIREVLKLRDHERGAQPQPPSIHVTGTLIVHQEPGTTAAKDTRSQS